MNFCLQFAQANRDLMMHRILAMVKTLTGATVAHGINIHQDLDKLTNGSLQK